MIASVCDKCGYSPLATVHYSLMGYFKGFSYSSNFPVIHVLFTGSNHYDNLVDVIANVFFVPSPIKEGLSFQSSKSCVSGVIVPAFSREGTDRIPHIDLASQAIDN